ncbi:hypothetical protein DV096_12650 [Bradymonadaceae bacterium TMQ3]|uniref:Uncharacterized protein n=1 Tax=Lujinxingia sediminis TaxID=2480984 RepID=A0ABY0CQT9_9DELT|nr:hypothetical protein [Lujinxingia sediminis]RDV37950.1 hypothetical protein DV096_12650 [Bradymonadaceae bacterium TMQ3]RVU42722.1 hypothetical protein EA187_14505 [Lujinxingia sediminis]TXC75272.1 hypothetical protein FRC91_11135 [Bradymonadales bacterium TMQ1]
MITPLPPDETPPADSKRRRLAIAGARGALGRALIARLPHHYNTIGLTRRPDQTLPEVDITRQVDLFSRKETFEGLRDTELAVYAIHQSRFRARLTQARLEDLDVLCADNFGRAAAHHRLSHILYVGCDTPPNAAHDLGRTREITDALGAHGVPVITLRLPIILDPRSALTHQMLALASHARPTLKPYYRAEVAPIAMRDTVDACLAILANPDAFKGSYALHGPRALSFKDLVEALAARQEQSLTWRAPGMVASLAPSPSPVGEEWLDILQELLQTPTRHSRDFPFENVCHRPLTALDDALDACLQPDEDANVPARGAASLPPLPSLVRSVQRLPLPAGRDARWTAHEYVRWLPTALRFLIRATHTHDNEGGSVARFFIGPLPWPILELTLAPEVSASDRQLFWITGGLLARQTRQGRLEFRQIAHTDRIIVAIHDFEPRLPWVLYRFTQAIFHLWVVERFKRHLERLSATTA